MTGPENPCAFPTIETHPSYDFPLHHFGMTLRDWFAGQAIAGGFAELVTVSRPESLLVIARLSYELADAMLAERANQEPSK